MRKYVTLPILFLLFFNPQVSAQIEIAKLFGSRYHDLLPGFGGGLKFSFPVSESADVTLDGSVLIFLDKDYPEDGVVFVPVKLGYRYTLNGGGTGFFVEPQLGYVVVGAESYTDFNTGDYIDRKFNGFVWAAGLGYLFEPSRRNLQFMLGLRFESVLDKGNTKNFIALRLSHNFTFGRRE